MPSVRPLLIIVIIIALCCSSILLAQNAEQACTRKCRCTQKTVSCRNARLKSLPKSVSKTITYFSVSGNYIRKISNGDFVDLQELTYIDLSNNLISDVEENGFRGPINLNDLLLKNNRIEKLPDNVFNDFSMTLQRLILSNNQLTNIPLSLEKLINLKHLDLSGNRIHCSCELKYFAKMLPTIEYSSKKAHCTSGDSEFQGQILADVNFNKICSNTKSQYKPKMPVFVKKLTDAKIGIGDRIVINCETMDVKNDNVTWTLPFTSNQYHSFYYRNHILVIKEVHKLHAGFIQCEAQNPTGRILSSANIEVKDNQKPYIIEGPQSQTALKGSTVKFSCRARGYPKPVIAWLWMKSSVLKLETNDKYLVRKNKLIIKNITEEDAKGRFICYASSLAGSAKVSATLTIVSIGQTKQDLRKYRTSGVASQSIKNKKLLELIDQAKIKINKAFNNTINRLRNPNSPRSRAGIQSLFRQPNLASLELSRASEVYEKVLDDITAIFRENNYKFNLTGSGETYNLNDLLTPEQIAIISQFSGCQRSTEKSYCAQQLCFHKKYRSIDGKCNNIINPERGSAISPFYRLLPAEYENGINTPIGWSPNRLYYGFPKPSARLVSSRLLRAKKISPDPKFSVMVMQWGQFLDHDLDFTPVDASTSRFSDGLGCNETCVNDSPCFPILTPPGDTRIRRPCIGFSRSIATCGSGHSSIVSGRLHSREQVNQITSFIDASNVYSSEESEATDLRDLVYDEGKLRVGMLTQHKTHLLPFNIRGQIDCQIEPSQSHVPCFKAGDHRNNENLGLLAMHTIWMREHNRISDQLRNLNTHWSGDQVYFEARKIIGALIQHITYKFWLPIILGDEGMKMLGNYNGYDDTVDPTISNVFSTAAMRFGHSLINPILYRLDKNFQPIPQGNLPLHKAFFAPHRIIQESGVDPILRGLYAKSSKAVKSDEPMNIEVIEKLFALAHEVALDLGALNIQRGRDHGLPPYNKWRKYCNLKYAETFDDFAKEIPSADIREKMREVYGHPGNVDLFAGGLLEEKSPDALVGPTFRCLLVDQFKRLREGDRFWYENSDQFEPSQLSQIKQVTLSQIICNSADNITRVQENVFLTPDNKDFKSCDNIKAINLLPWKECVDEQQRNDYVFTSRLSRSRRSVEPNSCTQKIKDFENRVAILEDRLTGIKNEIKNGN